jgi:hypothetical protein
VPSALIELPKQLLCRILIRRCERLRATASSASQATNQPETTVSNRSRSYFTTDSLTVGRTRIHTSLSHLRLLSSLSAGITVQVFLPAPTRGSLQKRNFILRPQLTTLYQQQTVTWLHTTNIRRCPSTPLGGYAT